MNNKERKTIFLSAYTELNIHAVLVDLTKADRDEIESVKILKSQLNLKILHDDGIVLRSTIWPAIAGLARSCRLKFAFFSGSKI